MRANRCGSVSVPAQWRLSLEFALLPNQLIIGVQHDEVVDVCRRNEVLLAPSSRVYTPASEKDDIRTADVGTMAIAGKRRRA